MAQRITQIALGALIVVLGVFLAYRVGEVNAPQPAPVASAPQTMRILPTFPTTPATHVYTVKRGDTLSEIAEAQTGSWRNYRVLATASGIANPDLIFPGQKIIIKGVDIPNASAKISSITTELRMQTREAFLILPLADNDGAGLQSVHAALRDALLLDFGGFTESKVVGSWRDSETGKVYRDESIRYAIAAEWTPERAAKLTSVARHFGVLAGQLAVYVRHGNGAVEFVDTRPAKNQEIAA